MALPTNGYKFEQALRDGEGLGSLASCGPWGCKELDTTERLNKRREDGLPYMLGWPKAVNIKNRAQILSINNCNFFLG